jgi:hypothetical protein
MSPQPPRKSCKSYYSPQVSCVSGPPDQISDDEVPVPPLNVTSPPQPSARAAAPSSADSDDEVPIQHFVEVHYRLVQRQDTSHYR